MCGCGKVSKLSDGKDAVVSFEGIENISVDSLYDNMKDRYAVSILIDMIDTEILNKEYENKSKEADDYADNQIKTLQKSYESEEELLNAINSYYGYQTIKEFKEYIKLNYLRDLATTDYAKKQITDKEIDAYYETDIVGDIEASHILITADVKDDATEDEKKKAEEKAEKDAKQIIEKLNNGEDFKELAKTYSKDESNKDNGGALGKFNKGEMEETFETAAYELELNKYTTNNNQVYELIEYLASKTSMLNNDEFYITANQIAYSSGMYGNTAQLVKYDIVFHSNNMTIKTFTFYTYYC